MKADTKNKYIECIDKQGQVFVWLFMDDEAKLQDTISVKQAGMNHPNQIQTMENDTPFKYDKFQIIYLYISCPLQSNIYLKLKGYHNMPSQDKEI